jgi:hypothetical protein
MNRLICRGGTMTDEELKVVVDMVHQHCGDDKKDTGAIFVDSMAISANAAAMRLLARHGLMEIDSEIGRRIRARWTTAGQRLNENRPFKSTLRHPIKWNDFSSGK